MKLIGFLCVLLLVPGLMGFSQVDEQPIIDDMLVSIWSEYDQPEVLVIYRMKLDSNTTLPARLALRIPVEAGRPYNVAYYLEGEMPYLLDYQFRSDQKWAWISFTTPSNLIQIEYYDPRLSINTSHRTIVYTWAGDLEIRNLSLSVQQPVNASQMTIKPNLGEGILREDGLTYYEGSVGPVAIDSEYQLMINYMKTDDGLSFKSQPLKPSAPLRDVPGQLKIISFLPWGLAFLGLITMILVVAWYIWWRSATLEEKQVYRRYKAEPKVKAAREPVYCHECGKRADAGDQYCRICGAHLRKVGK